MSSKLYLFVSGCVLLMGITLSTVAFSQTQGVVRATPISSNIEVSHTYRDADGHTKTQKEIKKYYRDAYGNTRLEQGNTVIITNNTDHKIFILNLRDRTAQEINLPLSTDKIDEFVKHRAKESHQDGLAKIENLGSRSIAGHEAVGVASQITKYGIRAGDGESIESEKWYSTELSIPVHETAQSSAGSSSSTTYTNIKAEPDLNKQLFAVPTDFKVRPVASTKPAQ